MRRAANMLCAIFTVVFAAHGEPVRELTLAKYNSGRTLSRLTLTFDSPARFLLTKVSPQEIRLSFPQTGSMRYASGVPLVFRNGNAKSVAFDFSRRDTMALIVSLRKDIAYDLRRTQSEIIMEMYPMDTTQNAVLDIRSLARVQLEEKTEDRTASTMRGSFDVQRIPLIASLVFSILTTGGMLLWILRPKPSPKSKARVSTADSKRESISPADAILLQARQIIKEKSGIAKTALAIESASFEREDDTAVLSRKFRRGQGELQLARTFENQNRQHLWEKKLQRLDSNKTNSELAKTAKQLGVGRGEINLAMSLRRMKEASGRKGSLV
jgi:hypothetical protein